VTTRKIPDLSKARVLISNDDGINAPGLKVLEHAIRGLAKEVIVVAPETENSGAGHALTLQRPLRIRKISRNRYAVDGTPTDCVLLAINEAMQKTDPARVITGHVLSGADELCRKTLECFIDIYGAAAGNALDEVAKLLPKKAHLVSGEDVDVDTLKEGDMVLVKPGEKIPADGVVAEGSSSVNEAHVSGEAKPVSKINGDTVVAGAIALDGSLTIKLTRVGEHSTIGQIKSLIADAQQTKPRSQQIVQILGVAAAAFIWLLRLLCLFINS